MSPSVVHAFLAGLVAMSFAAVGLCFVRFWVLNRDPLLIAFAAAFGFLAASHGLVGLSVVPREEQSWIYLLRVAAFVAIAVAIVRKNISLDSRGGKARRWFRNARSRYHRG